MNHNKKLSLRVVIILLTGLAAGCPGQTEKMGDIELKLKEKAEELARKYMIIDTHLDVPYRLKKKMEDISERTAGGDFDYPRAKEGGLDVAFMAVYVPAEYEGTGNAYKFADETIDMVEGFARTWPDKFMMARSVADVKKQFGWGGMSLTMGIENGTCLEGNLENLKYFHDRGISYITLAHSKANHICDSSFDPERKWNGLSPFGKKVVSEMNRLGMIVDVSHVSDDTFYQIIEFSKAPVVATHSSCRHFVPGYERNMSDEMIKLLAKKGGVIQINFGSMFIGRKVNEQSAELKKSLNEYIEAHNLEGKEKDDYIEKFKREHPLQKVHVSNVASHIEHVIELVGIDYVGLGSDYDGVGDNLPVDLEDVSCYPNLIYELLKKGRTEEDIEKICSGNFLRVWAQVEKIARELQSKH
ncbi:MAG TPA: peptidase M19 [Phycisphaerales bacterium]|nr:peptidase M19 [Phycisphaerales bacterium]